MLHTLCLLGGGGSCAFSRFRREHSERPSRFSLGQLMAGSKLTSAERAEKARIKRICENREDFMKRWFAIAISVGFATALSHMPWLNGGGIFESAPIDWEQIKQVARLAVAVVATILSWEGYLLSISNKPLVDHKRFYIDVFLVFLYLFLLLTSVFSYFWVWVHTLAFFFYIAWDRLSIIDHPRAYVNSPPASTQLKPRPMEVYRGNIRNDQRFYYGPIVTLLWPLYFLSLSCSYQFILTAAERNSVIVTYTYASLIFWGLLAYRADKRAQRPFKVRLTRVLVRALAVLGVGVVFRVIGNCVAIP